MKKFSSFGKALLKSALKEYDWFIHNCSPDRTKALEYAKERFSYGLYAGLIYEDEYEILCDVLPLKISLRV